ncbi:transposable element Tcb2 transposase [Trichonephila clavipes]|nr:transposable element Tcb2 transposase [Trichonephila clavipes]
MIDTCSVWRRMTVQHPPGSWKHVGLLLQGYKCRLRRRLLNRGLRARVPLCRIPFTANHGCVCNGLMSTEPDKLIGLNLSFQVNHPSICGVMMAAFMLDAMLVNAAFRSAFDTWSYGIPGAQCTPTCCKDCSAQQLQLLPLPAHSTNMFPTEYVWDSAGGRLARDPRPAASKEKPLLRIQTIWNSLPQADIQNLFDSMPRRIAILIATRGGCTKY